MLKKLSPFILVSFLFIRCTPPELDNITTNNLSPDIALPLASGEFGIEDILEDDSTSYYKYDNDGLIWLTYRDDLLSLSVDDLLPNNKDKFNVSRQLTASESANLATVNSMTVYHSEVLEFDNLNTNGVEIVLDSLLIKSGVFEFDFTSTISHDATLEVDLPNLTKNGIPFNRSLSVLANGTANTVLDLSGYKISIDNGGGKNSIKMDMKVSIQKGSSLIYTGGIEVDIEIKDGYGFNVAYGDVGMQDILGLNSTNLDIELFDFDEIGNTIFMEDAEIKLKWENSFGIPLNIVLNQIEGKDKKGGVHYLDNTSVPSNDLLITAPISLGDKTNGEIVLNNSNTTNGSGRLALKDFINKNINQLKIDAEAITNPVGVSRPAYKNFILDTSSFKLGIEASLPMHGRVQGYAFRDTIELDFGEDVSDLKEASIKIYTENGLPIDVAIRLEFVDDNHNEIFVLDNQPGLLLRSANVDANGKAISRTKNSVLYKLSEQNVTDLNLVKKVVIKASLRTVNNGTIPIKFYKDDKLLVKLGARLVANVKLD